MNNFSLYAVYAVLHFYTRKRCKDTTKKNAGIPEAIPEMDGLSFAEEEAFYIKKLHSPIYR